MLSIISAIYDPPGLVCPFIFEERKKLHPIVSKKKGWDEYVSIAYKTRLEKWKYNEVRLQNLSIPRCVKPDGFSDVISTIYHHFSGASKIGYGSARYIRQINIKGEINVSLLMGKMGVSLTCTATIPCLESTAGDTSANVSNLHNEELDIDKELSEYWCDSKIVLGCITNEAKRFRTFVANRDQRIEELTDNNKWHYVSTKNNPADYASRGLDTNSPEVEI